MSRRDPSGMMWHPDLQYYNSELQPALFNGINQEYNAYMDGDGFGQRGFTGGGSGGWGRRWHTRMMIPSYADYERAFRKASLLAACRQTQGVSCYSGSVKLSPESYAKLRGQLELMVDFSSFGMSLSVDAWSGMMGSGRLGAGILTGTNPVFAVAHGFSGGNGEDLRYTYGNEALLADISVSGRIDGELPFYMAHEAWHMIAADAGNECRADQFALQAGGSPQWASHCSTLP